MSTIKRSTATDSLMFERFDEDARSAVVRAKSEAIRTGQAQVGTEQPICHDQRTKKLPMASAKTPAAGCRLVGDGIQQRAGIRYPCEPPSLRTPAKSFERATRWPPAVPTDLLPAGGRCLVTCHHSSLPSARLSDTALPEKARASTKLLNRLASSVVRSSGNVTLTTRSGRSGTS